MIAVAGVEANRASSPAKTAWPLIVLMLTMISAAATRASLSPLQEVVKTDLRLDDFRMSLVQGLAASLPIALLSLPIGRLVDRTSRVRLLFAMALVWTVGELLTAFAHGFSVLFVARTLAGLGAVCALPAAISVAADLSSSERRGRALLLLSLGVSVGTALAFLLGGSLFQAFGGRTGSVRGLAAWRAVHLIFAAASALLALLLLLVREPVRREVGVDSQAPLRVALAELWSRRAWLAPLFVGQIGVVMADTAAAVWAAPLLTRVYGLQPGQFAGWMGLVILVPGLLGAVIGGVLADVGQRRRLFGGILFGAVASAALAIPFSLFSAAPSVTLFALMLSGFLFCGSVAGLVTATAIAVLTPNETRGVALGAFVVLSGIVGLGLAPTLVTLVSAALGGDSHLGVALAVTSLVVSLVSFGGFGLAALRGASTA